MKNRAIAVLLLLTASCAPEQTSVTVPAAAANPALVEAGWRSTLVWAECERGSGKVTVFALGGAGDATSLVLASGEVRGVFLARPIDGGDIFEGVAPEAEMNSGEPVLAAFKRTGILSMGNPPAPLRAATSEELLAVRGFFDACT
jgi:hypothetical protein